jgi:hypothetical protein
MKYVIKDRNDKQVFDVTFTDFNLAEIFLCDTLKHNYERTRSWYFIVEAA